MNPDQDNKHLCDEIVILKKRVADLEWGHQRTNEGIKVLYRDLALKNEKLKKYDLLRAQFVANVSHEYKSPLAIIRESISLVLGGLAGSVSDQQKNLLETGLHTADRLHRLVMDTLELSQIEAGKMTLKREILDIGMLAHEIFTAHRIIAQKRMIEMQESLGQGALDVWGDKDALARMVNNLVSNAVKYSPDKGTVGISLFKDKHDVRLEVKDTGPGIAEHDFVKVFDKYERINAEKQEGTGLGLPIAKEIVNLHQGRIWIESVLGQGSTFVVTLPCDLRRPS